LLISNQCADWISLRYPRSLGRYLDRRQVRGTGQGTTLCASTRLAASLQALSASIVRALTSDLKLAQELLGTRPFRQLLISTLTRWMKRRPGAARSCWLVSWSN